MIATSLLLLLLLACPVGLGLIVWSTNHQSGAGEDIVRRVHRGMRLVPVSVAAQVQRLPSTATDPEE